MKDFIRKAKTRAQHVELYRVTAAETPVKFENNRLKSIDTKEQRISALRLIKDGKLGFATTTGTDLNQLLEKALLTARFGRDWQAPLPGPASLPSVELFHPSTADISSDKMVDMGQRVVEELRQCHPEALAYATLNRRESTVSLVNSSGFAGSYSRSIFSFMGSVDLVEGKNMLCVYRDIGTGKLEDQVNQAVKYMVDTFNKGRKNVSITSGAYPVVFTPQAMGDLLYPLLACANGKAVEKGFSPWKDKLGQQLFSPRITLYDDPTIAYGPGSAVFDGEGMPAAVTNIIKKGVISNFLLDLDTAHSLGMKPTGNGYRGSAVDLPAPGNSNVVLEAEGTEPLQEIMGGIKKGVIIHSLMGAWAGNPFTGQVSGNIDLGFLVEKGEVVGRVKDCMMSINVFEAFKSRIEAVSQEREWEPDYRGMSMLLPYILFDDVSISTKG